LIVELEFLPIFPILIPPLTIPFGKLSPFNTVVFDKYISLEGNASFTTTFKASASPLFSIVIINSTISSGSASTAFDVPVLSVTFLTNLSILRSGVLVGVAVGVAVGVLVGVAVGVLVGVEVGVLVGVTVGVLVGVAVGVLVGVLVGVAVGVAVGVLVGVEVGVLVGVTVGV
jgi:hypothetical protein